MSGLEWPKGTGKTALYTAGLWVVGQHRPTGLLRTANMDYNSEYQPGPLLEVFNTATNDDTGPVSRAEDERYRLYTVNRGDTSSTDYAEWPGDLGAPYVDVNGNGQWDQGIDRPRFFGDQQIWAVINDVNNNLHASIGATPPMGLEVQMLFYGIEDPHPLENTLFVEWKLINKSDADYDSAFIGLFSDIDLGHASDDLPGCDTTLDLGYFYNGDNDDKTSWGYGSTPPALGFTILKCCNGLGEVNVRASVECGRKPRNGTLSLSSVVVLATACREIWNPRKGTPEYAPRAFYFHQGKTGDGVPLRRPDSSIIRFWFSGDPVVENGDLPQNFPLGPFPPYDAMMMLNMGPFTLEKGDTVELDAALVLSQGADRLESVTLLRRDVAWVRNFYESGGVVSVDDDQGEVPEVTCLHQNYPNPFNPSTTIEFALPRAGYVTINVYNLLGERVATIAEGDHVAGTFEVRWDASRLPSGVYFYRLTAHEYSQTRKMVLIR
jgi:hypothetical protein